MDEVLRQRMQRHREAVLGPRAREVEAAPRSRDHARDVFERSVERFAAEQRERQERLQQVHEQRIRALLDGSQDNQESGR